MIALDDEMTKTLLFFSSADFQLSGPVVDLSLYECSARRKIPVRSLIQPINIELQQPPGHVCSLLLCSKLTPFALNHYIAKQKISDRVN